MLPRELEYTHAEMRDLPLWFLIGTLFIPRICLLIGYFLDALVPFSLNGWIPPALAVLFPRVLVIVLIFQAQGMSGWLLVHGLALLLVYGGGGARAGSS